MTDRDTGRQHEATCGDIYYNSEEREGTKVSKCVCVCVCVRVGGCVFVTR